ncbi:MAG: HEAT repeat domain-containing protein [Ardenticatenaceae bacterium]|nr:HEAT repeat domain-containing protein [Ardenticatenaceae bacterium]
MNYSVRFESLQEWAMRHTAVAPLLSMPTRIRDRVEITNEIIAQLRDGMTHPNPRVRFECAHLADHLDDDRCFDILVTLSTDEVPRVRAEALHGLACERCKSCPLPIDSVELLVDAALHDPSDKVRDKMVGTFAFHSPDPRIQAALQHIAAHDNNPNIRRNAVKALKYHS